jgi:uncharacterized membrane protein YkvI
MASFTSSRFFRVIVIPAAVFQSVIFGGAYGTGREIAEFISVFGPNGGLLAVLVLALGFGLTNFLSFELARIYKTYDYRGFLRLLTGRAWITFEVLFLLALLVVLAVNGAAAASVLNDRWGVPSLIGVGLLFAGTVALNYFGRTLLQESMAVCMIALTAVLAIFCVLTFIQYHESISTAFRDAPSKGNWLVGGLQYMLYTVAVIPALLYSARDITTRGEALVSAFAAGAVGALPALVFHLTFMAAYPQSLDQALPTYWMLGKLASPWLTLAYIIVLFAMIIQTVAGLLQGVNERLDAWSMERRGCKCAPMTHAIVAGGALIASMALASYGIADLVAKGYGNLAWGFLVVYMVPLLTVGVYKIWRKPVDPSSVRA